MEKDLLMGPVAVVAVTHSSLYWLVGAQEADLGAMARSCWEERMKEAVVRGRRADSAVRRRWGCMLFCLFVCYTYALVSQYACCERISLYPKEKNPRNTQENIDHQGLSTSVNQGKKRKPITPQQLQSYC